MVISIVFPFINVVKSVNINTTATIVTTPHTDCYKTYHVTVSLWAPPPHQMNYPSAY